MAAEAAVEEEKKEEEPVVASQPAKKKANRKPKKTREEQFAEKEEDLNGIGYFNEPKLVENLWTDEKKIIATAVYAKGNYSYILEKPEGSKTN